MKFLPLLVCLSIFSGLFCDAEAREFFTVVGPKFIVADRSFPQPFFDAELAQRPVQGTFDLDRATIGDGVDGSEENPLNSSGGSFVPAGALPTFMQISASAGIGGGLSSSLQIEGRRTRQPGVAIGPATESEVLTLTFLEAVGGLTFTFSAPAGANFDLYVNGEFVFPIGLSSGNDGTPYGIFDPRGASIQSVSFVGSSRKFIMGQGTIYGDLPPLCEPIPDLLITKRKPVRLKGENIYDRNRPSAKQTLVYNERIFTNTRIDATVWMENDGGETAQLTLRSSGDRLPGMAAFAKETGRDGRKNISAALRRGNFSPTIQPGFPVKVAYSLRTNRFWAGVLRGGNRDDTIQFRLSGAGRKDNAAIKIKHRGPAGPPRID